MNLFHLVFILPGIYLAATCGWWNRDFSMDFADLAWMGGAVCMAVFFYPILPPVLAWVLAFAATTLVSVIVYYLPSRN